MASGYYDITSKTLGKGHYGIVKLGRHCLTGEPVAIKIIEKSRLNHDDLNQLGTEIRILFRLSEYEHPNILKLYQTIDTEDKLFLVTEYCGPQACDLHNYLLREDSRDGLSEREAQIFFVQICSAISYCHSMGIVHRDLKPENILVTDYMHMNTQCNNNHIQEEISPTSSSSSDPSQPTNDHHGKQNYPSLKLIDFGFADQWYPGEKMRTSCGTLAYSAPELLLGEPYDGTKVDVWGLGLMLYTLLYGGNPFMQINDNETLTKILDCSFATPTKDNVDSDAVELLRSLIKRDPETRLPIDAILKHNWFSKIPKPPELTLKNQQLTKSEQSPCPKQLPEMVPIISPTSASAELSEKEKKLHERVVKEMFTLTKFIDSRSSIEASLKKRSKAATTMATGLFKLLSSGDANQAAEKPRGLAGTDKLAIVDNKLSNDDYIYATYQLTRDRLLKDSRGELMTNKKAGISHEDAKRREPGASRQALAYALPLARKCSLVSEESGCSNDVTDSNLSA